MLRTRDRGMPAGSRQTFNAPESVQPMIDATAEPAQLREASQEADDSQMNSGGTAMEQVEPLSFAARARAILLLSLLCWATLVAALCWLFA